MESSVEIAAIYLYHLGYQGRETLPAPVCREAQTALKHYSYSPPLLVSFAFLCIPYILLAPIARGFLLSFNAEILRCS